MSERHPWEEKCFRHFIAISVFEGNTEWGIYGGNARESLIGLREDKCRVVFTRDTQVFGIKYLAPYEADKGVRGIG